MADPHPTPYRDHLTHLTFSPHWSINVRVRAKVTLGFHPTTLTKPPHHLPQMSFCTPTATLQSSLDFHNKDVMLYTITYSSCIQNVLLLICILFCMRVSPG